jgi:hypothetical protein
VKTIWIVMPLFPVGLVDHCVLSDGTDLIRPDLTAGQHETRERPAAKLILTLEDFDADYFMWGGYTLVSEKMRRAMALGPSDIQYFDVDASESALLPKSKHYQIMHVPVTEYMTDQKNLAYRPLKVPRPSVESRLASAVASGCAAEPTHEIFYDRFRDFIFCTDEFAMRVLQSDCSGITFWEPFDYFADRGLHFRTLRGVEEDRWDPASNSARKFLIRGVH